MADELVKPEEKRAKFTITVAETEEGQRGIVATMADGSGMKLIDLQTLLQWALNKVQDDKMSAFVARYIDHMLEQKINPNGFRPNKVMDFLTRKR